MTQESAGAVQAAVYGILSGDAALGALLGGDKVFDHVPAGTAYPYVVIGDMETRPFDTQGASGNEVFVDIHAYVRERGQAGLRAIMAAVHDALHDADFAVAGQTLILCRRVSSSTALGSDGETRAGRARFRIVTET